jgi:hypothetical protein
MPVIRWLIPCARGPMSQGPSVSPTTSCVRLRFVHTTCGLTELNEASSLGSSVPSTPDQIANARKLPLPVTSLTVPFGFNSRSRAVRRGRTRAGRGWRQRLAVCGAMPGFPVSAFGVSTGVRSSATMASGSRDRLSQQ